MITNICSCKLYRASSRKEKILAAMQDPLNSELMIQVDTAIKRADVPSETDEDIKDDQGLETPEELKMIEEPESDEVIEDGNEPKVVEEPNLDTVEEAVSVTASNETVSRDTLSEIKGMLNVDSATCGVNRTQIKENEFWIYYNDNINLNNIMADVICRIDAAGYSYLEFNRLARTDNALVFEITMKVSDEKDEQ